MLVCYHLTLSKMIMTVSVGHSPISFLYVVKKESSVTNKCGSIPVGKNLFNFSKIALEQRSVMSFF